MTVHHLTPEKAREVIADLDAGTQRIAEFLWLEVWGNAADGTREWTDNRQDDGQWNYCVEDAKKLSNLFGEMIIEATSY